MPKRYEYGNKSILGKISTFGSSGYLKTLGTVAAVVGTVYTILDGYLAYQADHGFGRNWYKFVGRTAGGALGAAVGAPFGLGISTLVGISGAYNGENYLATYYDRHYPAKI